MEGGPFQLHFLCLYDKEAIVNLLLAYQQGKKKKEATNKSKKKQNKTREQVSFYSNLLSSML